MIKVENISVVYKNKKTIVNAVKDVSFQVNKGEIFGIVGSSGAGKSSLIRTLNRLELPSSGRILIDDVDINKLSPADLRTFRFQIGMIFQGFNLASSKTVYDNIAFVLRAAGKSKEETKKRVFELLDLVGLRDKANEYPSRLSGGQKQRVGIARALANNARVLLCDEATSALDPQTTSSILDLLKELNKEFGLTIILITHELDVVKQICDRVAIMSDGDLVEVGTTYDIFSNPKKDFSRSFIEHEQELILPESILETIEGKLIRLQYANHNATEPILHRVANKNNIETNIIHGKIEYINELALGILFVELQGEESNIESAIKDLQELDVALEVIK